MSGRLGFLAAQARSPPRAQHAEGRISTDEAAPERAGLVERHLARVERLRAEHGIGE
jgi:hypothetical protein